MRGDSRGWWEAGSQAPWVSIPSGNPPVIRGRDCCNAVWGKPKWVLKFKLGLLCSEGNKGYSVTRQQASVLVPKMAQLPEALWTSETFEGGFESPHAVQWGHRQFLPVLRGMGTPRRPRGYPQMAPTKGMMLKTSSACWNLP